MISLLAAPQLVRSVELLVARNASDIDRVARSEQLVGELGVLVRVLLHAACLELGLGLRVALGLGLG